jgi:hypothetical protein
MSDFETRSKGAIAFPSRYAQGYAYLRSKVYGDRPGVFMGDQDVRLWMPRNIVRTDDPQANYLTGYGNGRFYLALSNESADARTVVVRLDRERVPYAIDRAYEARVWVDGKPSTATKVVNGTVTLQLAPKGLTAIAVEGLPIYTRLHSDYFEAKQPSPSADSSFRTDATPVGGVTAMLLSFAGRQDFYLWTSASDEDVLEARLNLKDGGGERTLVDRRHPFEFSAPAGERASFDYQVQFVRRDGSIIQGERRTITR